MSEQTSTILDRILETKRHEITIAKRSLSLDAIKEQALLAPPSRDFANAILHEVKHQRPAVIAEIKKASPSKGVICENFHPAEIAKSYEAHGASCLSVLTDKSYFQGDARFLMEAKAATALPILRKDFIIDAYQIYESRALGADCILLIVAALTNHELQEFDQLARTLNMSVLVESHNQTELKRALEYTSTPLIGINNRNLKTFQSDLATSIKLAKLIHTDKVCISESAINTREDIARLSASGIHSYLIGEAFMRADDPGQALSELFTG